MQEGLSISAEGVSESAILAGGYSPDLKEIRLDTMNPDLAGTLSHELGHAIDDLYFNYQLGKDPELVTLFSKDKKAFVKAFGFDIDKDYSNASAEQKVHEYFAESFAQFVLNNPKLKTAVPDTYEKIKQILQKESV
ncbi:hypothetical protein BK708_21585 [Bacillus thuringiensis serovar yunnanensis]|nr:hypothetical protein BK708_21585 [Bacillus thuringiensis serovar yunnanensis]